jgi:hypothetical protein
LFDVDDVEDMVLQDRLDHLVDLIVPVDRILTVEATKSVQECLSVLVLSTNSVKILANGLHELDEVDWRLLVSFLAWLD